MERNFLKIDLIYSGDFDSDLDHWLSHQSRVLAVVSVVRGGDHHGEAGVWGLLETQGGWARQQEDGQSHEEEAAVWCQEWKYQG